MIMLITIDRISPPNPLNVLGSDTVIDYQLDRVPNFSNGIGGSVMVAMETGNWGAGPM